MTEPPTTINRTLILESELSEVLAHFYICNDRIIAVSGYGMFAMYQRSISDPRTLQGSPWIMTYPSFLDYIARVCAYTNPRHCWTLRHPSTGAFTKLCRELMASSLANTTGIDTEEITTYLKHFLVFHKPGDTK